VVATTIAAGAAANDCADADNLPPSDPKPAGPSLPPLLVVIEDRATGEFVRQTTIPDPRDAFCRYYNQDDRVSIARAAPAIPDTLPIAPAALLPPSDPDELASFLTDMMGRQFTVSHDASGTFGDDESSRGHVFDLEIQDDYGCNFGSQGSMDRRDGDLRQQLVDHFLHAAQQYASLAASLAAGIPDDSDWQVWTVRRSGAQFRAGRVLLCGRGNDYESVRERHEWEMETADGDEIILIQPGDSEAIERLSAARIAHDRQARQPRNGGG
jgi:hypothetical protein